MMAKLSIPADALDLILSRRTPKQSYADLIEKEQAPINDLLTFGLMNTPIFSKLTGKPRGYVVLWENRNVTTVDAEGKLMGVEIGRGYVTAEEAVEIFDRYWAIKAKQCRCADEQDADQDRDERIWELDC